MLISSRVSALMIKTRFFDDFSLLGFDNF